jgi:hypothetical protein
LVIAGQTIAAVAIGIPMGVMPVTRLPRFAGGRHIKNLVRAVLKVIAPATQRGPATISPIQATGRHINNLVGHPGPRIRSPVAVRFTSVAMGVILFLLFYSNE